MKRKIKTLITGLLSVVLISLSTLTVLAIGEISTRGIDTAPGELKIPFEKKWTANVKLEDRVPVNITLYKYIGDNFNPETAIKVGETVTVDSSTNWKHNFDISAEKLIDSNNNHYKFKVVETPLIGYEEIEHIDPNVNFTPPIIDEKKDIITTCSNINIDLPIKEDTPDIKYGSFIAGTLTNTQKYYLCGNDGNAQCEIVVWTEERLSEGERNLVAQSISTLTGPFGKARYNSQHTDNVYFITGTEGFAGMSVDDDSVNFEASSQWQMVAIKNYAKSTATANSSSITNNIKTVNVSVEKIWNDDNNKYQLRPENVTVQLVIVNENNEVIEVIETLTLSNSNDWKHTWTGLKELDANGNPIKYVVKEINPDNYTPGYSKNGNTTIITNTLKATTISITKRWENVEIFNGNLPTVIVQLYYCDPKKNNCTTGSFDWRTMGQEVQLNANTNWSHSWNSLPETFIYDIKEVGFTGLEDADFLFDEMFDITYDKNGNNFTITNTFKGSSQLPETGSSGGLIIIVVTTLLLGIPTLHLVYTFAKKSI